MQNLEKYVINGGKPLKGEVEISGAKNAAVAIIPAALLVDGVCRIENMPQISDTDMLLTILSELGAKVRFINKATIEIDCRNVHFQDAPFDLMRKIRASYYLIGAMLGRFGEAEVAMPGGCNFGSVRPIDQHIKGMTALGAEIDVKNGFVYAEAPDGRLHGARIYLDKVSVGATMNIILAATLATGRTIIENAAREPHIVDLANFLNSMGADIRGAGTDTIKINGVEKLHGGSYTIIPDQIEAGTYMVAAAATGGEPVPVQAVLLELAVRPGLLQELQLGPEPEPFLPVPEPVPEFRGAGAVHLRRRADFLTPARRAERGQTVADRRRSVSVYCCAGLLRRFRYSAARCCCTLQSA